MPIHSGRGLTSWRVFNNKHPWGVSLSKGLVRTNVRNFGASKVKLARPDSQSSYCARQMV